MPSKIVVARFTPKDQGARDVLLELLRQASDNALMNESGTLRYAVATDREAYENGDNASVYVIEKYADQAAVEAHMKLRHVQELLIRLKSSVSQEPEVWMLDQCEGLDFTRATATAHPDPFIVFTELEYKPGTAKSTMPYWEAIFKSTRDEEQGALLWELAKDERHGDRLFAIHTYESRSYLMDVHAASQAVQNSLSHGRDNQIGIKVHFLKLLGGYLNRE